MYYGLMYDNGRISLMYYGMMYDNGRISLMYYGLMLIMGGSLSCIMV